MPKLTIKKLIPEAMRTTKKNERNQGKLIPKLKVGIVGGGPVGLATGIMLALQTNREMHVTIFEPRWIKRHGRIAWCGKEEGNFRRGQVVTLQSIRWANLPRAIQSAILQPEETSEMWPTGPASPAKYGPPKNVRIKNLEDNLLNLASKEEIALTPRAFDPEKDLEEFDVIAICDGARSPTREYFSSDFGIADTTSFNVDGKYLTDHVLSIQGRSNLNPSNIVAITAMQNRYLLNSLDGYGFLNMRLTLDEAGEAKGVDIANGLYKRCIQSNPCIMRPYRCKEGKLKFKCPTHGTYFKPALEKYSFLWPRVQDGMKLFDMSMDSIEGFTIFKLGLQRRSSFCSSLTKKYSKSKSIWGFLLGDAAIPLHFWPGRGLNTGLASAVEFVKVLANLSANRDIRASDFTEFQGTMSRLQHREISRAWSAMIVPGCNDKPIRELIAESFSSSIEREAVIKSLLERAGALCERIGNRMKVRPDLEMIKSRIDSLETATLNTLYASGAWDTFTSGGNEVEVELPEIFEEEARKAS